MKHLKEKLTVLFFTVLSTIVLATLFSCTRADLGTVYTEEGVRAAEGEWDRQYRERLAYCQASHASATPEAEACFGTWYDSDAKVETTVGSVVGVLRAYWIARAAGGKPDWATVAKQVAELLNDLPPEAKQVFNRVKGIK